MRYDDAIDESKQYLRLALELIGRHGLPTDPLNYCLWYEYASGRNEELNSAVDGYLDNGNAITGEMAQQLFNQHIASKQDAITNLVREELNKLFAEILLSIKTTKMDVGASEANLNHIEKSLDPASSVVNVGGVLQKIKHEIRALESTSSNFKEQLEQATSEIKHLKNKMAQYRDEALKDPLTRIANRRGFDQHIEAAIAGVNQHNTVPCLILADIDHFKNVNDIHGHLVGDHVLRLVAATIKSSIKGRDIVARIGGEEFAVLLPSTPFEGAMTLAESMRSSFERLNFKSRISRKTLGTITLSFGVTKYKEGESIDDFIQRADEALYKSKNTGRNKVTGI